VLTRYRQVRGTTLDDDLALPPPGAPQPGAPAPATPPGAAPDGPAPRPQPAT
jgi:hypothetical protein